MRKSKEEQQFLLLLSRIRQLEERSWRKPHYYLHLRQLHEKLGQVSGVTVDIRIQYEKELDEIADELAMNRKHESEPSQITELLHRRRHLVEEKQKHDAPKEKQRTVLSRSDDTSDTENVDINDVLKIHKEAQGKLADQMLAMTRNLKSVSEAARDIITKDNKKLGSINDVVDVNAAKLDKETKKLEKYNESSGRCRQWSLIFMVIVIFMFMVLFIRIIPKRRPA